jgi:superfamily I DNA/RNA helicase
MRLPTYQELSKEQLEIYNLPLKGNYLVTGPPGTGKTVMALYRAQMYAKSSIKPQLLMFNNTLKDYTQRGTNGMNIDGFVETFHRWFWYAYPRWSGGERAPEIERWVYDWNQIMPVLASASIRDKPAMLVDEGQDLPPELFTALMFIAEHTTVFADENQRITEKHNSTLRDIRANARIKPDDELLLTRNYRNTREIARLARCFYVGLETGMPDLPERSGGKPVAKRTADMADAADFIARYERTNAHQTIGVLVPDTEMLDKMHHLLARKETNNRIQFYSSRRRKDSNLDFAKPGIQLLCFASAKGLEFDTVFMPELQSFTSDLEDASTKMQLYVLLSRARDHLYLLYSGTDEPPLLRLFPDDLIDKRS